MDKPTDAEIAEMARAFIHETEMWEAFESLKDTQSASLPVEFSNLGYAIEERFGPPKQEDEDKANG